MEVLRIDTEYYELSVFSSNLGKTWEMFRQRCTNNAETYTKYQLDTKTEINKFELYNFESNTLTENKLQEETSPVFFENHSYTFDIVFKEALKDKPRIQHSLKSVVESFHYRKKTKLLSGTLNFMNDPGSFILKFSYSIDGKNFTDSFYFDVVSRKLDFKSDYLTLLRDINNEYNNLVFDFLKKTYSSFQAKGKVENELIWFAIFERIIKEYIKACKYILNKPQNKLVTEIQIVKADKIKNWSARLEEEVAENRDKPEKYYRHENKKLISNTLENRFIKYTVIEIGRKFSSLFEKVKHNYSDKVSKEYAADLEEYKTQLKKLKNNSFFRGIGRFEGFKQESQVLQKRTGYAQVYKHWILFKKGINLLDGINKISLKDISELYEIWCFLQMKNTISSFDNINITSAEFSEVRFSNFVFNLKEGQKSKVTFFNKEKNEEIELYHELSYSSKDETKKAERSFTVTQRPDIILKIKKNDIKDSLVCTYLYDAKYRLENDKDKTHEGIDYPPEDSINQMHRYRDAIYYSDKNIKSKEIIGGYVLYPGRGSKKILENTYFVKSVQEVNIGAFPLIPSDKNIDSKDLLKEHLHEVLNTNSSLLLNKAIPQKGIQYEEADGMVLIGFYKTEQQKQMFIDYDNAIYHVPVNKVSLSKLDKIKHFAPYINSVAFYYDVIDISVQTREDIQFKGYIEKKNSKEAYFVIRVQNKQKLNNEVGYSAGHPAVRYGSLSSLRKVETLKDFKANHQL